MGGRHRKKECHVRKGSQANCKAFREAGRKFGRQTVKGSGSSRPTNGQAGSREVNPAERRTDRQAVVQGGINSGRNTQASSWEAGRRIGSRAGRQVGERVGTYIRAPSRQMAMICSSAGR